VLPLFVYHCQDHLTANPPSFHQQLPPTAPQAAHISSTLTTTTTLSSPAHSHNLLTPLPQASTPSSPPPIHKTSKILFKILFKKPPLYKKPKISFQRLRNKVSYFWDQENRHATKYYPTNFALSINIQARNQTWRFYTPSILQ
jgi:hypothetical protein